VTGLVLIWIYSKKIVRENKSFLDPWRFGTGVGGFDWIGMGYGQPFFGVGG
jgi:hypothetical protein